MFILNKEKTANAVSLLLPIGVREFVFKNELTKKTITKSFEGIKNGDYTLFIMDATDIPQGSYVVEIDNLFATKCVCMGITSSINSKYQ